MRTPGDSLPSTASAPTDTSAAAPQTGRSRSLLREEDFQKARQRIAASEGDLEIAARAIEKAREADPQKSEELEAMGAEVRIQRERMAAISARLTEIENEWRAIYAMPAESGPIRRGPGITVPKRALKPGKGAIKGDSSAPAMPK
jgi:chromosome segregation ATPase